MKTLYKTATIVALLGGLAVAARADFVVGSWQGTSDDGWYRVDGSGNNLGSILASSNSPSAFELESGVVAGYAKSLGIHEYGYGNCRMQINLTSLAGGLAAWTNNSLFQFTFSCQPGSDTYNAGYMQLIAIQYNSSSGGWHQITGDWTANGFTETGATGNNSGGQPIFHFWSSAPAQSQVVTWDYSSIKASIGNSPSYLQITFVFQVGGGAPTNVFLNNVVLSGAQTPTTPTIIVDQFNPTNNPYAGTNIYAAVDNEITNVYNLWTGYGVNAAVDPTNIIWDSTQNCTNTPNADTNSGALKFIANFAGNNQFVIWDRGPNNTFSLNPPITTGLRLLSFEFDVKYDPSSPTVVNGGVTNYGHLEWGVVPTYDLAVLGSAEVAVTNASWTHVTIPLNPAGDSDLLSISGMFFKQYAGYYGGLNGQSILWLDNLKFTYTNLLVIPRPTVAIAKPVPGLRLFTGGGDQYGRSELITASGYENQSWVGATTGSPVICSFTVKNIPTNMNQTHIFLIPVNSIPDTSYNGQDYTATNGLWVTIGPSGIAQVSWKTNFPGKNAYDQHIALRMTNSPAAGTWTLSFTSPTNGTLTGPGCSPVAFTITNGTAAADFADPVAAYFGCQPNGTAGIGGYEDWSSISITGTENAISEDFTTEPNRNVSGAWRTVYGGTASGAAVVVSTNDMPAYWVNWTLPAVNYAIGTSTNLISGTWINPAWYDGYYDETAPFGMPSQFGTKMWVLLPKDDLPTVDGTQFGVPAPTAFFLVATNVVSP